jgi:predicted dehydrogenase
MLRWGLLSTARINDRLIDAIRRCPEHELVAVASRSPEAAAEYAAARDIPVALGSYAELADFSGVDVVYVPLPNHLHAEWAIRLAEAGKHVLCEKPLALSVAEVDAMRSAAERAGVILQEACPTRFHPQTAALAEAARSPEVGGLHYGHATFTFTLPSEVDIRLDPAIGGGALWDVGGYPISVYQAVMGRDPAFVTGHAQLGPTGVDLSFAAQLDYDDGASVHFFVSMAAPISRQLTLVGHTGTIHASQPWLTALGEVPHVRVEHTPSGLASGTFGDQSGDLAVSTWSYPPSDVYVDEVRAFEAMVVRGEPSPYPLTQSRANIAVACALLESAATGQRIPVSHRS